MRRNAVFLSFLSFLLSGCLFPNGSFDLRRIAHFEVLAMDNPTLRLDRMADIDPQGNLSLDLPDYVDATNLIVRFQVKGMEMTCDGITPQSGVTAWDLSHDRQIQILGYDDIVSEFQLHVNIVPADSRTKLDSFRAFSAYQYSDSGFYGEVSYPSVVDQAANTITVLVAPGSSLQEVPLQFSTDAASVEIGGKMVLADYRPILDFFSETPIWLTNVDLTDPVDIVLTAEDGTTRDITVSAAVTP